MQLKKFHVKCIQPLPSSLRSLVIELKIAASRAPEAWKPKDLPNVDEGWKIFVGETGQHVENFSYINSRHFREFG
jgi:hypothetical protein